MLFMMFIQYACNDNYTVGRVFSQKCSITRQHPASPMQYQMNAPNNFTLFPQPHSSQIRTFVPQVQQPQLQQQNYNIPVSRSNIEHSSLGTAPHLLPAIPADHIIPSSSVVTTVAMATSTFSTLQSSSYTYSQTTTVDTIMTTVQCGNSSHHRSLYSVCGHPTSMASFQVSTSNNGNEMKIDYISTALPEIPCSSSTVISSVNVSLLSTSQASVPVYSLTSQSNIPLAATKQSNSTSLLKPTGILEIFQHHYLELIRSLPMNDGIFLGKLYINNLLPHNFKATIESLHTPVERATKFLDNIIKPSVENNVITTLNVLLTVMMDSNDYAIKELAERINIMLNQDCLQSEKGN